MVLTYFAAWSVTLVVFSRPPAVSRRACVLHPRIQDPKDKRSPLSTCTRSRDRRIPVSPSRPALHSRGPGISNTLHDPSGQHQKGENLVLAKISVIRIDGTTDWLLISCPFCVFVCIFVRQPVSMQDENGHAPDLSTPPCNGTSGTICTWEDDEPEPTVFGVEDHQMPEMPNLESCLGNSLRSVRQQQCIVYSIYNMCFSQV